MNFPFDDICKSEDRSWSSRLVQHMSCHPPEREVDQIGKTLEKLADPRTFEPLSALVENKQQPPSVRDAASRVLAACNIRQSKEKRRELWQSGETVLMRHALRTAEQGEASLLEEIAQQPDHEFYEAAIERLRHGFGDPKFQQLIVSALSHQSAAVRKVAAAGLLDCHPVFAEEKLIALLNDSDDQVVRGAIHTLIMYTSQAAVEALHRKELSCTGEPRRYCRSGLRALLGTFRRALESLRNESEPAAGYFEHWLSPIAEIMASDDYELRVTDEDEAEIERFVRREPKVVMTAKEFAEQFGDLDGCWKKKKDILSRVDYDSFSEDEKKWLSREFFPLHPDAAVRARTCRPLSMWNETEILLGFLDDPDPAVRWSAVVGTYRLSADPRIEARLKEIVLDRETPSDLAWVALDSFAECYSPADLYSFLAALVQSDPREAVRARAVNALANLQAKDEIASLRPLIEEAPLLTWAVHTALISACTELEVDLQGIELPVDADDVYLQSALALALA